MRPCEVGPPPNFGSPSPFLKQEEELLSLHKRSLDDLKPSSPAQWILPSPPPTAKQQLREDSESKDSKDDGKWLPISPPLTAYKPKFTTTTTAKSQQPPKYCPKTPPPTIAPAPPTTSNLRAIAPKQKKQVPLTIPTVGYEEMFKDTPRLIEEVSSSVPTVMRVGDACVELMRVLTLQMKKRGQSHVEARRRGGKE